MTPAFPWACPSSGCKRSEWAAIATTMFCSQAWGTTTWTVLLQRRLTGSNDYPVNRDPPPCRPRKDDDDASEWSCHRPHDGGGDRDRRVRIRERDPRRPRPRGHVYRG